MTAMIAVPLGSRLRAFCRLSLYVGFTLPMLAAQLFANLANLPLRKTLPMWYHKRCCRILAKARLSSRGGWKRTAVTGPSQPYGWAGSTNPLLGRGQ